MRRRSPILAAVGAVILASCAVPLRQYEIRDEELSCDEANRLAYEALTGMGFHITEFEPAEPGRRGTLEGERQLETPRAVREAAVVTIDCTHAGVLVDAKEEGKVFGQADFKRGFLIAFTSVRNMAARRAEMEAKMAAGSLPPSLQRRDVRILLEPVRGEGAKLDFGLDLQAAGILPLRIRIDNLTARTYRLDPTAIRLTRVDRTPVEAMPADQAAAHVAGARPPETDRSPRASLSRAEIADRLRAKAFAARRLAPGAHEQGFLYFPAGEYTRARVLLTDEESGEMEGVAVEF